jgi:glucose-1-phosphate thymidylyltransferase
MKGLILSGGKGTRLRPLTYTSAKQLVPVANKPVLFYGIEAMAEAGITELGIVVGETHEEIRAALGDGSRWGCRMTYIMQPEPLGLAHAVKISRDFLGESPFVMYLGDNLLAHGIRSLVEEFEATRPNALILLTAVPNPQQFGVAELVGERVVRLEEKPQAPRSNLALVGVYMFTTPIFEAVSAIQPSQRGELEITDAIQYLIDKGYTVSPHVVRGWWKDTGKIEDMLEANRLILETLERRIEGEVRGASQVDGKVVIEAGAVVEDSVVRGPVVIGARSQIVRAYVGPFSAIGADVTIRESEVEHSIVLEGSSILDLKTRVEDSLIGRNCRIHRSPIMPRAVRLMIGDRSEVGIQ